LKSGQKKFWIIFLNVNHDCNIRNSKKKILFRHLKKFSFFSFCYISKIFFREVAFLNLKIIFLNAKSYFTSENQKNYFKKWNSLRQKDINHIIFSEISKKKDFRKIKILPNETNIESETRIKNAIEWYICQENSNIRAMHHILSGNLSNFFSK